MKRRIVCMAMIAGLSACGGDKSGEPAAPASEAAATDTAAPKAGAGPVARQDAPPASQATASAGASEPPFAVRKGDRLEVKTQADCVEFGPGADDVPWSMFPGVTVEYVGIRDGKAEVIGASGDHCLMAWDVLAPS